MNRFTENTNLIIKIIYDINEKIYHGLKKTVRNIACIYSVNKKMVKLFCSFLVKVIYYSILETIKNRTTSNICISLFTISYISRSFHVNFLNNDS